MRLCLLALLLIVLVGCGGKSLELAPVKGQVALNGKGIAYASIQLIPDEQKGTSVPSATGQTDADGRFEISTPPHGDGAAPGHYRVTVTTYGGTIPTHYADPIKTPLSVEVPKEGLEDWKLELKP
jgi:hypothetical protein